MRKSPREFRLKAPDLLSPIALKCPPRLQLRMVLAYHEIEPVDLREMLWTTNGGHPTATTVRRWLSGDRNPGMGFRMQLEELTGIGARPPW